MIMANAVELWEMNHPDKTFFQQVVLNSIVDRDALWYHLQEEYSGMLIASATSEEFHASMLNFFIRYKWNIDKLAESLKFDYIPLDNYKYKQIIDRGEETNRSDEKTYVDNTNDTGQVVNLVSAFNDIPSPSGTKYNDTEHDRSTSTETINVDGYSNAGMNNKLDIDETLTKTGHSDTHSFQELIEQERRQAMFNIYEWIAEKFCRELLIGVW